MYSILIIEDDATLSRNMELILQLEGFNVSSASDGPSAFAMLREKRPDLILCDIMMPGMDGLSVLAALKGDKTFADIPFIFVTAMGDRADVRRGMVAGADDYLPKPFSAEDLIAAVTARLHRLETIRQHGIKATLCKEQDFLLKQTSAREREVLHLVGRGVTSKDIAVQLGITLRTVDVHRSHLMSKLGVANAAELARWAVISEQIS